MSTFSPFSPRQNRRAFCSWAQAFWAWAERFAQILHEGLRVEYVLGDGQTAGSCDRRDLIELELPGYFVDERGFDRALLFHVGAGERVLAQQIDYTWDAMGVFV